MAVVTPDMKRAPSRTVRIFLSSTFRHFGEERDLLVRKCRLQAITLDTAYANNTGKSQPTPIFAALLPAVEIQRISKF